MKGAFIDLYICYFNATFQKLCLRHCLHFYCVDLSTCNKSVHCRLPIGQGRDGELIVRNRRVDGMEVRASKMDTKGFGFLKFCEVDQRLSIMQQYKQSIDIERVIFMMTSECRTHGSHCL